MGKKNKKKQSSSKAATTPTAKVAEVAAPEPPPAPTPASASDVVEDDAALEALKAEKLAAANNMWELEKSRNSQLKETAEVSSEGVATGPVATAEPVAIAEPVPSGLSARATEFHSADEASQALAEADVEAENTLHQVSL